MKLLGRLLVVLLVASGFALAGAAPASACGYDCVSGVTLVPSTWSADAYVNTTVPTKVSVFVSTGIDNSGHAAIVGSYDYSTSHRLRLPALRPGTIYFYSVAVSDQAGNSYKEWASSYSGRYFRTLHREVTATISRIRIVDDSDDATFGYGPYGNPGDLNVSARVGSTVQRLYRDVKVESGFSLNPNVTLRTTDQSDSLPISVAVLDDDSDPYELCTRGTSPSFTNGSDSCADWGTAEVSLRVLGRSAGNYVFNVTNAPAMRTPSGVRPGFEVWATYSVRYFA